jgi:FAD/FMN-containing dehydrogenase
MVRHTRRSPRRYTGRDVTAAASPALASATEVRDRVREARERGERLRLAGAAGWLGAGRPVPDATPLPLAALSGVVDYVPGDFTITVRAGTTLAELARITAAERQWVALDPFGAPSGTVGATVATASAGPLAHGFGPPRDNVLGLEVVTGRGEIVRAGGRVVKNVAGFDLVRLFTGSWGTLGAVTEVTLRTRALPEVDETWVVRPARRDSLDALLRAVAHAPVAPWACELVNALLAASLGAGSTEALLVRLAGSDAAVAAQRAALARLGEVTAAPADVWERLRAAEPRDASVARISGRPSDLGGRWGEVKELAGRVQGALLHATAARSVVRCIFPTRDESALRPFVSHASWPHYHIERMPDTLWRAPATDASTTGGAARATDAAAERELVRYRLMRRTKAAFDPIGIMNPGILGETIG